MADDLERFLKDEPIRARRPTPVQRARRWARRHRPVVWSAAASLLVGMAVLAGSAGWIVRDQVARQAKFAADLQTALREAEEARKEGKWARAQAAAKRAEGLLEEGAAKPDLAERVRNLLRELAEEEADRRLVARLEELRLLQAEVKANENAYNLERALPDYREAFDSYGLRPDTQTPKEAADLLRRRPPAIRGPLLAALDHWLILARYKKAPEKDWLKEVLSAADTDPWRRRMRAAREANDRPALEKLAREVDVATQPAETLFLLAMSLRQRGAQESLVAVLRRAQEAFPGDFWINHHLGVALKECRPPQAEEAIRFLTAAVALRPTSPGARLNLASALEQKGRLDEAAAAFRQAIALKPDYAVAHGRLGFVLLEQGRLDEATAAARRAIDLEPALASHHYFLGIALSRKGQLGEAAAAYRRAIDLKPDFAEAHCNLGCVLQGQGELAPALAAFRRGHELGSRQPGWSYPSARWVEQCRRLVELEGRLPDVLGGKVRPADAAEEIEYARLCYIKKCFLASARLRAEAFAADPKLADDLKAGHRYDAACAAVLAAAGAGADAGRLDDRERARWRKQALEWLRADLAGYGRLLEGDRPKDRRLVVQRLRHCLKDSDLASLSDDAVVRLPADEQQGWRQFWAEVQALLARADVAP
jgi:serine/threonine-protein kinase